RDVLGREAGERRARRRRRAAAERPELGQALALRRIDVGGGRALDRPVVAVQVDGAPVGERGNGQAGERVERRAVIERPREDGARLREERRPPLGGFRLRARRLLAGEESLALRLDALALHELP